MQLRPVATVLVGLPPLAPQMLAATTVVTKRCRASRRVAARPCALVRGNPSMPTRQNFLRNTAGLGAADRSGIDDALDGGASKVKARIGVAVESVPAT